MTKKLILHVLLLCLVSKGLYADPKLSKTDLIKVDFKVLAEKKKRLKAKDASLMPAYKQLLKDADALLNYKPVSVMDKTAFPPSGNKHDYMSIGPYWWPDPAKADGLPYIRKDGEVNPEVRDYPDKENMPKLCENVNLLAIAYYYSNDEKYAKHAAKLLKVWFLDTTTCMNPNLKYGQAVKGKNEGRAEGVIDTRQFIYAIDGIQLLKGSKSWTTQNNKAIKKWFSEFLNWLNTSTIGQEEMNAKNNHGVWFDAQALSIALFVDSNELANKIVLRAADRLDKQLDNNGLFPYELERNTSLHYSVFILNAFDIIAQLSEQTKTNFWTLETKSGKSFKKAFDAILPFISKEKEWTAGKQIKPFGFGDAVPLFLSGSTKLNCTDCMETVKKNTGNQFVKSLVNLL